MPRFVILEHDHPHLHYDLMLEAGDVLRTWRLATTPDRNQPIKAESLGDHRKLYLDYEGPVSGNRGQVKRWDAGTFEWLEESAGRLVVWLEGRRCSGAAILERTTSGEWTFSWKPDRG
jgi:hypothetical protein